MGKKTNKKLVVFGVIATGAAVAAIGVVVLLLAMGILGNTKRTEKTADVIYDQKQDDILWNVYDAYEAYTRENLVKDYIDTGLNQDMYEWKESFDDFSAYVSETGTFQYSLLRLDADDIPELLVICKMKKSYDDRFLLYCYTDNGVQKVDSQKMFYGDPVSLYYEKYQGKLYGNSAFQDEDEEDLEANYEMAVYDGKKCQEQGRVSVTHKGEAWEEILCSSSLGSTMLRLKNETGEGGNIPQIAEKTTEKSANIQTLTAEEESYRAYQQYINQGKVIEDYCKDSGMTLESEKREIENNIYESDTEDTTNFDDLRIYLEREEWPIFNYGLAKLDADDSLEMVVTTGGRGDVMYYTYKDGKVQQIAAKDDFCFWTIYYREKQNKLYVYKSMESNVAEIELTTYSDDQLKVEITYGTDEFGYGGAEQYEINNKRVSKAKYEKSLAEKTGGNQGWKCIWFGDSLQESYQKGNEESKIY